MRVIVAGGGLVGLTTAIALRRAGADVVVCEQAPEVRAAGASIGLWSNALAVFDEIGVGERLRAIGAPIELWFYDAAGRRTRAPEASAADHGFLILPRPRLNELLADAAARDEIRLRTRVVGYEEGASAVSVRFADGSHEEADLLVGADGVHSAVREQLLPGMPAQEHVGHHAWRAMVPSGGEPPDGHILTVGHHRTRGGYARTYGDQVMWMVNQFDCHPSSGTKREQALALGRNLNDGGWNDPLIRLIEATPEHLILHNQIMIVPPLPRWVSARVALIGDAAHGLSPHIAAGGTLGIEDVAVLTRCLASRPDLAAALAAYEANRRPHYATVRELSRAVEGSSDAAEYARHYAAFSRWMLNEGHAASLSV